MDSQRAARTNGKPHTDARETMRDLLAGELEQRREKVVQLLDNLLDAEKYRRIDCPKCHERVAINIPDVQAQVKGLEMWLSQALGRAPAAPTMQQAPTEGAAVDDMDEAALLAILQQGRD